MFFWVMFISVFPLHMCDHSVAHSRAENWSRVIWRSHRGNCEDLSFLGVMSHSVSTFQSNLSVLFVIHYCIMMYTYLWSHQDRLNRPCDSVRLHGITSQITAIFRIGIVWDWFFLSLYQWLMGLEPFGLPWLYATLDLRATAMNQTKH
jgi:hypothetical protein